MHQLFLLRHAKAVAETTDDADHGRALSAEGVAQAAAIGQAMRAAGLAAELVLVSTAKRTRQTLEALQAAGLWAAPARVEAAPELYLAEPEQMLRLLQALPETVASVLLIGHNPGIQDLAMALAGGAEPAQLLDRLNEGFPTAGLAALKAGVPWARLTPGKAVLERFLSP